MNSSFIIPPEVQYQRDLISLQLLQQEKKDKTPRLNMLVNSSQNPKKELWKDTGIDGEIARRKLIMDSLLQRMSVPKDRKQPQQQEMQYPELIEFLRKSLSGDYE